MNNVISMYDFLNRHKEVALKHMDLHHTLYSYEHLQRERNNWIELDQVGDTQPELSDSFADIPFPPRIEYTGIDLADERYILADVSGPTEDQIDALEREFMEAFRDTDETK